ncbi:MAG: hypothetical protein JSY10_14150 [Paenibacillus sp.]|nr:hypothetical protein [Paenibacillus sp.]
MLAKPVFYEEVMIPNESTSALFTVTLATFHNGVYVHHLALPQKQKPRRRKASPLYSSLIIQYMFQSCPNLLSVDLDICNPYYFLRSLVKIELDKLQQIKIQWSSIRRFGSPAVKRYFLIANQLHRKSILSLEIPDIPDSVWTGDNTLSKQDYMSQFLRLEHLTINQSTHVFISFSKILSSLPKLKTLHYISLFRSLGITDQDILDSSKVKYVNLKSLSLEVFHLSVNDIEYIINSLPSLRMMDTSLRYAEKFKDYISESNALIVLVGSP